MTLETTTSIPDMELELDDFSSSSKTTKKTYIMTKHVSKKVSSSVTSSSATSTSANTNQKMASLFNNDLANSIGFDSDASTSKALANIDMNKLGIDMDMGLGNLNLDMDLNLDMKSQLANMEKQMNTTCQKVMGISSTKKTSKQTSLSSTSSSSVQNTSSSSSNNTAASSTSSLNSIQNSPAGPFVVKIPIGADINPEDLQVALEENEGLSWMTIRAAQEKTSETANSKSTSSFRIIKKFTIPSNVNTQAISSTFTYEGEQSILKIEAPTIQSAIQQQDVPVAIKFED